MQEDVDNSTTTTTGGSMTPAEEASLALDLRVQLLETLVGLDTALAKRPAAQEASIARRGQAVIAGLYESLDKSGTEAIKRFLDTYEVNKALLVPQLPTSSQAGHDLTPSAKAALILDSEMDFRNLDRELREIEILETRGSAAAGKLQDHENIRPQLDGLRQDVGNLSSSYGDLEHRVENLLSQYDEYVDTVSELFVSWNSIITDAERAVTNVENERRS